MALPLLREMNRFKTTILSFCVCAFCVVYAINIIKRKRTFDKHILKKKIITEEPKSSKFITFDRTCWIVPLKEYASFTDFFGIRTENDVFVFDKNCPSVFSPGKTIEIINLFSENELKIGMYYLKHQQASKSNVSLIREPFLFDLKTMMSSGSMSS